MVKKVTKNGRLTEESKKKENNRKAQKTLNWHPGKRLWFHLCVSEKLVLREKERRTARTPQLYPEERSRFGSPLAVIHDALEPTITLEFNGPVIAAIRRHLRNTDTHLPRQKLKGEESAVGDP